MVEPVRKRLTREESRAQTRERLLDAAIDLFIKVGIDATSIEDVAEAAGYSRGAFYSNFESKDDLVCAALQRDIDQSHDELGALFDQPIPTAERLRLVRQYYVALSSDEAGCMLWMAMQLYALRNPAAQPRIAELLRLDRERVVGYVVRMFADLGVPPPAPPEVLAISFIAQAQGIAIARMVDPTWMSIQQFEQVLGAYFDSLIPPGLARHDVQ